MAFNPQSRFGLVQYRLSDRDFFAYIVISGDVPKAHYVTVGFTEYVSMYEYFKSISYGLTVVSHMNVEDRWSLIADEISRVIEAIRTIEHPMLSIILESRGTSSALIVDRVGSLCLLYASMRPHRVNAGHDMPFDLWTVWSLNKKACPVCAYSLIVLRATTIGCTLGSGIVCLIRGG